MKNQLAIILLLVSASTSYSQVPDLSWTFQWETNTYGLLFEDTNLTAMVKGAIRDDVQGVLAYNPTTNAFFHSLTASDPQYNIYAGRMTLDDAATHSEFPLSLYKVLGGTNYFAVTISSSSNYTAKIVLTNQQQVAISGLSNFLVTAQNMTTSNTTIQAFQQKWWHPLQERIYTPEDVDADAIAKHINAFGGLYYYYPSVLSFEFRSENGKTWFGCKVWTRNKSDLKKHLELDLVYGGDQWRFVPLADD